MARSLRAQKLRWHHFLAILCTVVLFFVMTAPLFVSSKAGAALLQLRSVKLSDGTAGFTPTNYEFGFTTNTSGTVGSILFEVCQNYQYDPTDICTPPAGFDAAGAALSTQTGVTDFSLHANSDANTLIITRPAATPVTPQPLTYEFTGISNPTNIGSYYVRISTYPTLDASGPEIDYGNVVFVTNIDIQITTEVPPYLQFCTGITIDGYNCGTAEGNFISFGELSVVTPRVATSQMLASTNAPYGYSITLAGSTLTAGNNVIPALESGSTSVPGTSQFGLNAVFNSNPSVGIDPVGPGDTVPDVLYSTPNQFRFKNGEIIASNASTDDYRKLTVSYIVNRSRDQAPGRYVATISYICLANF
jgi:hypothetical protein